MKLQAAIRGFLMDWELRGRSAKTLQLYRSCLMVLARWLEGQGVTTLEEVTVTHLRGFILETQQRPAGSVNPNRPAAADGHPPTPAMQGYVKAIKLLFKWLVEEEVIGRNPALRLHKPPTPSAWSLPSRTRICRRSSAPAISRPRSASATTCSCWSYSTPASASASSAG